MGIALKTISDSQNFLEGKKKQLEKLAERSKNGSEFLIKRIDEILMAFEFYKEFFPRFEGEGG
jgi:hypothetical protein